MSSKTATFKTPHFDEGRFRFAYEGNWTKHPSKRGKKMVVKEKKDSYTWEASDWDTTLKVHTKATELAGGFNSFSGTDHPIRFTEVDVLKVTSRCDPTTRPKLGEYVITEDYIEGQYKKWCNNYGFLSRESLSMPAFMHWSWVHTKGELMVADLQGVRKDNCFFLTDPVIMSMDNSYGCTDTGVEGMIMFFYKHECNQFCRSLPKPSLSDFVGKIPTPMLEAAKFMLQTLNNSTTYKIELKFDAQTKKKVTEVLRDIARRKT